MSLESIFPLIRETEAVRSLLSRIRSGEREVSLSGVAGSLGALLAAAVRESFPERPLLFLSPDEESGQNVKEDLEGLLGRGSVFWFPESDALEGQRWPTDEVAGDRLAALAGLASGETGCVVVTTPAAMLQPTAGREWLQASITTLKAGETPGPLDLEELVERLVASGYERLPLVSDLGELSVRGGIVDAFPHGRENPVRIEFLGDEIVSLREFDPITQRSVTSLDEVTLLPRWETSSKATLLDHLPSETVVFQDFRQEEAEETVSKLETRQIVRLVRLGDSAVIIPNQKLKIKNCISFGSRSQEQLSGALNLLRRELAALGGEDYRAFILCENEGQRERLEEILQGVERAGTVEPDVSPPGPHASLLMGTLIQGFIFPQARVAVFTDHEVFGRQRFRRHYRRFARGTPIRDYLSLTPGDCVVHIRFGIGRYQGLTRLAVDGKERDCLQVVYRDGDKLYVPLEEMKQVERYLAKEGHVPVLSKLGGTGWEQVKSRARKAVQAMAKELLALYASRQAMQGFKYASDTPWQKALEASFP